MVETAGHRPIPIADQRLAKHGHGKNPRVSTSVIMANEKPHRSYVETVFSCRCPRCRQGKLFIHPFSFRFKRNMEMHDNCPVCNQPTDIEVGFYYGTGYISYLIGLLITAISCIVWL